MSKNRKWKVQWSYGYCGTGSEEIIDLIDDHGWSEEKLEEATDEEIQSEMSDYAREQALQNVDYFASPIDSE
jgi:hypothetical protein